MTTYFTPGALACTQPHGMQVDRPLAHLDPTVVEAGDTVIGTLPINLAAQVCARSVHTLNPSLVSRKPPT